MRLTPDVPMFAVASPTYLKTHGEPKVPADLHKHACINFRFPGSGAIYRWQMQNRSKKLEMAVEGLLISNFQEIVLAAALQGIGIMYAYDHDGVDEALAAGRLTRVLADWSPISPVSSSTIPIATILSQRCEPSSIAWWIGGDRRHEIGSERNVDLRG